LLALLALAPAPAQSGGDVFAPSFWDPQHRIAKPDLTDLRSIRFLTEDDYPPFHFATADGALAGFDVDLARALCDELKVICTIQARRWDTLIEALDENNGDALIAAIRIDPQTRAKLDFTAPYYKTPARFATLKATQLVEATPESLAGKTIGVEAGSAHEAFLETFFGKSIRKPYASQTALREALQKGEIDALFGDGIALSRWLEGP
jgi:polar amino acid transport system substrate-binding protein